MLEGTAWWLANAWVVDEESVAAAAPAITTDKAKMRTASFIFSYPSERFLLTQDGSLVTSEY
jgi:hypothetical protein